MYVYTSIAYGFDFSDDNIPSIGKTLSRKIIDFLEEGDLLQSHYSGASNPRYVGVDVGVFDPVSSPGVSIIDTANKINKKVNDNLAQYNADIISQIDDIINDLNTNAMTEKGNFGYTDQDISDAVDYFNSLKLADPSVISLIATS